MHTAQEMRSCCGSGRAGRPCAVGRGCGRRTHHCYRRVPPTVAAAFCRRRGGVASSPDALRLFCAEQRRRKHRRSKERASASKTIACTKMVAFEFRRHIDRSSYCVSAQDVCRPFRRSSSFFCLFIIATDPTCGHRPRAPSDHPTPTHQRFRPPLFA